MWLVTAMLAGTRPHLRGLVRQAPAVEDAAAMCAAPSTPTLHLIGAPTDVGAGVRGAGLGPGALRAAGLVQALRQQGLSVEDEGDLTAPHHPANAARQGNADLYEVHLWSHQVADAVQQALVCGHVPVVLGGDHSLAMGSVAAVARHCARQGLRLQVVWLDAHADCNTPATSPTGHWHGMPLACLLGEGPDMLTGLVGPDPVLLAEQVGLFGVRNTDPGEDIFLQTHHIEVVRLANGQGAAAALASLLSGVDAHTHVHLSLDLDVLDPLWAPGVTTPVPGGLDPAQALHCMQQLHDTGRVGSVDLVELNPQRDVQQQTAHLAVDLMVRLWTQGDGKTQSKAVVMSR